MIRGMDILPNVQHVGLSELIAQVQAIIGGTNDVCLWNNVLKSSSLVGHFFYMMIS